MHICQLICMLLDVAVHVLLFSILFLLLALGLQFQLLYVQKLQILRQVHHVVQIDEKGAIRCCRGTTCHEEAFRHLGILVAGCNFVVGLPKTRS